MNSSELEKAIKLRNEGNLEESNNVLCELAEAYPDSPVINYQYAWSFDVLGLEREAIPYYEKAMDLGLSGEDLESAVLGLGSSFRALGNYEKSKEVFEKGIVQFPENQALKVFHTMTLYNLKDYQEAMEILLKCIAETSSNPDIQHYKRAIYFYADKLDDTWD